MAFETAFFACGEFFQQVLPKISETISVISSTLLFESFSKESIPIYSNLLITVSPTNFTFKSSSFSSFENAIKYTILIKIILTKVLYQIAFTL